MTPDAVLPVIQAWLEWFGALLESTVFGMGCTVFPVLVMLFVNLAYRKSKGQALTTVPHLQLLNIATSYAGLYGGLVMVGVMLKVLDVSRLDAVGVRSLVVVFASWYVVNMVGALRGAVFAYDPPPAKLLDAPSDEPDPSG